MGEERVGEGSGGPKVEVNSILTSADEVMGILAAFTGKTSPEEDLKTTGKPAALEEGLGKRVFNKLSLKGNVDEIKRKIMMPKAARRIKSIGARPASTSRRRGEPFWFIIVKLL